jgi:hypothetical protein
LRHGLTPSIRWPRSGLLTYYPISGVSKLFSLYWNSELILGWFVVLDNAELETLVVTEFSKIFSGSQPRQGVKVVTPPTNWRGSHSILGPGLTHIFTQAVSSTLKMGTGPVPETLENIRTLTRLCSQEDFIEFFIRFGKFWDQTLVSRRVILAVYCGIFQFYPQVFGCRDSSVGIAIRYGLDGPGIK